MVNMGNIRTIIIMLIYICTIIGFVLNAFELEGESWIDGFQTSLKQLPIDKPKLAYGLSTPGKCISNIAILQVLMIVGYNRENIERCYHRH